jgi:hypothetical protein
MHPVMRMSTIPTPKPPEQTRRRQTRYLVGAGIVIAALVTALTLMDRQGASRDENRARSNENHSQNPPVPPESR